MLAQLTCDPKRYKAAAKEYSTALRHARLGKIDLSAAEVALKKAEEAAAQKWELRGDYTQAEEKALKEIANFLQAMVEKREGRDDLWPEGRLELGITCAALKDYLTAEHTFEDVMNICESGGKYRAEQFAIAA
jgi:hypothetical protein